MVVRKDALLRRANIKKNTKQTNKKVQRGLDSCNAVAGNVL